MAILILGALGLGALFLLYAGFTVLNFVANVMMLPFYWLASVNPLLGIAAMLGAIWGIWHWFTVILM